MTSSMGRAFAIFCSEHGVDPERFKSVIADAYGGGQPDGMVARLERGELELAEFERWLAGELWPEGAAEDPPGTGGLKERIFSGMEADLSMVGAVGELHAAGVRTALLSNSWGASGYERDRFPDLFDAVVISAEVGMRKPEPGIYLHAAQLVGAEPAACVFVDDLEQNVVAARELGMHGIVHRSAEFTIPRLEALFAVRLPATDPPSGPR
jgi:FMN phosphatase YigB (HAD superfamily)